jgi:sporulation protein YlmC with PRC-barrel domain
MKKHLIIVLSAIVGLFLGANGITQEKKGSGVGDIASKAAEGQQINAFLVEKIRGSKVMNLKGETLGKIEDLVVDIDTGRIVYAVIESDGHYCNLPMFHNERPITSIYEFSSAEPFEQQMEKRFFEISCGLTGR